MTVYLNSEYCMYIIMFMLMVMGPLKTLLSKVTYNTDNILTNSWLKIKKSTKLLSKSLSAQIFKFVDFVVSIIYKG